jgi:hypothetical protein
VNLLRSMPKLFIHCTRYTERDLNGITQEVHSTTVERIFSEYPNTFRELALEKRNASLQQHPVRS